MSFRRASFAIGPAILLTIAAGCRSAPEFTGRVMDPAETAAEITATNWDGEPFRLSDHRGQVAIVFFGYTFCPDVCPFTLAKMKSLYAELGQQAQEVAVVFVSVDPHRDTVERLAGYVPSFDERFYGLHLDSGQLETVMESYHIFVQYGQPKDGPGTDSFYQVDHTGTLFIIDPDGLWRLTFSPDASVEDMLPDIRTLLAG